MSDAIKAVEELNRNWHELKGKLDRADEERAAYGAETAEIKEQIRKLSEAQTELDKKMARPAAPVTEKAGNDAPEIKAAFNSFLRKGGISPDERKLLSLSDDTQSGYLAPREMVNDLIKAVTEMSPIRSVARIIPTSAKGIEIPKRTGLVAATWAGDGQSVASSNSTYGMERIDANMLLATTDVSVEMLEDSAFDLAGFIQGDMAEQFGASEGAVMVSGNGVDRPQGLLTSADLTQVANGHASVLQADAIIGLTFAIKTAYAQNGTFALNRNTLFAVYSLKDNQGQYLYRPNQDVGRAPTIQGRPYIEAPDMPDVGANAFPIIYGDFRRGYTIADRVQLAVIRDELSQANSGVVRFVGRKRVGGQVVLGEALAKLKIATSI